MHAVIAANVIGLSAFAAGADVIYVDDSATAGANTGESWPNAFTDLQSALAIATAGDEIRVGQGTYKPAPPGGDRTISFNLVSGTILQGGYAGFGASDPDANDPVEFETILSGDINNTSPLPNACNEESVHVVTASGAAEGTSLHGVTVRRGCAQSFDKEQYQGGGLRIENASRLTVSACLFADNRATFGGGAYVADGCAADFSHCRFINNRLRTPGLNGGGGVFIPGGTASFVDCAFEGNMGTHFGGGVYSWSALVTVDRCRFVGNWGEVGSGVSGADLTSRSSFIDNSGHFGGAVSYANILVNCDFRSNSAQFSAGAAYLCDFAINCAFIGNTCGGGGGAMTFFDDATLIGCTLVGNRLTRYAFPPSHGAAISVIDGLATLHNCVLWDNRDLASGSEAAQLNLHNSTIDMRSTAIQGWTGTLGGVGNHGNDPRFVDADGPDDIYGTADDDPRLRPNSPCIDSGDATLLPPDSFDLDNDGDVTEPLPIDLDGLPRVVGANLDMGAFEFQGIPCRADIDGDSSVGIDDLLAVISGWGPCVPREECNADLNLDNAVTLLDLQRVIDDWGACR